MSYLHELECHCVIGGSADVESIGAIDALMSLDPVNFSVDAEAPTALASPCRSTTSINTSFTFTVLDSVAVIPGDPSRFEISSSFDLEAGDNIVVVIGDQASTYNVISYLSSSTSYIIEIDTGTDVVIGETYTGIVTGVRCNDILPYLNTNFHHEVTLETSSAIEDDDIFLHLLLETFSEIEDGLTANYSVSEDI